MAITARARAKVAVKSRQPVKKLAAGSLRSDIRQFTRDRLIAAAMDVFMADGFRLSSVERIVELAGTTVPTFYRHFSSKNDLLIPLQETLRTQMRQVIARIGDIETVDFVSVRKWLDCYLAMRSHMHQLCVAYWEVMEVDSDLAAGAIPCTLADLSTASAFFDRFEGSDRASAELRFALILPMLDRAGRVIDGLRDESLKARAFDEVTNMVVLALNNPGGSN